MMLGTLLKIGAGLALAGGAAVILTGGEAAPPTDGTRHGVRHEGCLHFELTDRGVLRAWVEANADKLRAKFEGMSAADVQADPELALTHVMSLLFPECQTFEDATFGPGRLTWDAEMSRLRAGGEQPLEGATAGGDIAWALLEDLLLGEEPYDPRIPTPEGTEAPPVSGEVIELVTATDFEAAELAGLVDPQAGATLGQTSMVVFGYAPEWPGSVETLERIEALAAEFRSVTWVVFDFATSRDLLGQPEMDLAYVATAVDDEGRPMGNVIARPAGGEVAAFPEDRWAALVDYAARGYETAPGATTEIWTRGDKSYTVLFEPAAGVSQVMSWTVWEGPRASRASAMSEGEALTGPVAREQAEATVPHQAQLS